MRLLNTIALILILAGISPAARAQFVQQGTKLVGTGAVDASQQGFSVAVSGDGNTALVGGWLDNGGVGAAWVFTRSGGTWAQQGAKLVGTGNVGISHQGISVSLSADGNIALVGGYTDAASVGAVWVFTRSGGVWTQQGSKLVGTGAAGKASQGCAVSLSADGKVALVGGFADAAGTGAAWIFARNGSVWTQQGGKLAGTAAFGSSNQGYSVSLSADGSTAIVGGMNDNNDAGAAWVFSRNGTVWTQQGGKLHGTGSAGLLPAQQGVSVSLSADGNTALVGGWQDDSGVGATWVFTRSGGAWTQQGGKLVGIGNVGAPRQGISVSLSADGNTALIGGYGDAANRGAAWIFARNGSVWMQHGSKLVGADSVGASFQGFSVSLSADATTALLGGCYDANDAGAAWAFHGPPPIVVSPGTLPSPTLNQSGYNQTVSASGGTGALALSHSGTIPPGMLFSDATGILSGTPAALGTYTFTVTATDTLGIARSQTYALPILLPAPGVFTPAAPLATARYLHTTTLLTNGKVLVTGGATPGGYLRTSELYDPASNKWSPAGNLATERGYHTATLLPDGRVLVTGGHGGSPLSGAEIYDPASNMWSDAGSMATVRYRHTATLLSNGKVLVAAGQQNAFPNELASAELYDPATNTWAPAASLAVPRREHTATLLPNGKVLAAGGYSAVGDPLMSAELYDPASNSWSAAGNLSAGTVYHTATLLPNGKVLVAGGYDSLKRAQLYDPAANTWSVSASMANGRQLHTASLLPNGKVLVAGGYNGSFMTSAELYDPAANAWSAAGSMVTGRSSHAATLLPSGRVLVTGGQGAGLQAQSASELFDSAANIWTPASNLATARWQHTATLLPNGKVLVAGGSIGFSLDTAELYDPALNTWSTAGTMAAGRAYHTATLLPNGKVLIAGGYDGIHGMAGAELYDPVSNTWSAAGTLAAARFVHTAILLPLGKVLVAGGAGVDSAALKSAEIYDPQTNTWTETGGLLTARYTHAATLLANGKVLFAGGTTGGASLNSAELYDPSTNAWSAAGNLAAARDTFTLTLLPNGKVLAVAGYFGTNMRLNSAELYDPALDTWSAAGTLAATRSGHTAVLMPGGKVLVAGGFPNMITSELYDPTTNAWSNAGVLNGAHYRHTATLLPSGKVLIAGGGDGASYYSSTELTDDGLQYQPAWRPNILNAASPLLLGSPLTLTGSRFKGLSEASGSATNFPIVQLRSLGNEQTVTFPTDPSQPWSDTAFTSLTLPATFPTGYASATVFTNGIPSVAALLPVTFPLVGQISVAPETLQNAQVGVIYSQEFSASGAIAPYSFTISTGPLPAGLFLSPTGLLSGTPAAGGVFTFTVSATDSSGGLGPFTGTQVYTLSVAPPAIVFTPTFLPNAEINVPYNRQIICLGGTAPYKSFTIIAGALPTGMTLGANSGTISGTPTAGGAFTFTVSVTDSSGGTGPYAATHEYTLNFGIPTIVLVPATLPNGKVGVVYGQAITGGGGTPPYKAFTVISGALPAGLSLNSAGIITGTPTAGGTFNFTVSAKDSSGGAGPYTGTQSHTVTVTPPTIVFAPASLPSAKVGAAYTQALTSSGGTAGYSYELIAGALPPGLSFATTGVISGTPTAGGIFDVTIQATDSSTGTGPFTGTQSYTMAVTNPAITFTPAALPAAQVGSSYIQTVAAGGGTSPYSFAIKSGSLPAGLTFTSDGTIGGIPTAGGTFDFTISATDSSTGGGPFTGNKSYSLSVAAPAIDLAPATLPDGQVGSAYSHTITAGGGTAPYSFALVGGDLPEGLALGSDGTIHGTPAAGGTFTITVGTSDSSTGSGPFAGIKFYTLSVAAPVLALFPPALANGQMGVPYNQSVAASGGTGPYSFTVTEGTLPAGMTLDGGGTIGGTPTAFGAFNLTITATDSSSGTGPFAVKISYTLSVLPPAIEVSGIIAAPNPAGVGQTVIFSAAAWNAAGNILTYAWQFGDSLGGSGNTLTHVYTAAGTYTVTVQISDGLGQNVVLPVNVLVVAPLFATENPADVKDSDGDGFSDDFENAVGSDPTSNANTPLGLATQLPPAPTGLEVKPPSIKLNFVKPDDSISLSGKLPVPPSFSFAGQFVIVQVGGFVQKLTLDTKGHSTPKSGSSFVIGKPNKKTGLAAFRFTVAKANLAAFFAGAGLTPAASPNTPVKILVTVLFNNSAYRSTQDLLFTQKKGKLGSTKPAR